MKAPKLCAGGCGRPARSPKSKWCADCKRLRVNQSSRKWQQANPEKRRELDRISTARPHNRARRLAYFKVYHEKNREARHAYRKAHYQANKDRINGRKKLLRKARVLPAAWVALKAPELQECKRLSLRELHLPCGKHEACSGCEKIGGRRVDMAASGFRFGHGM